jgi:membrane-bound lytic murein transglycosylase B
MHDEVDVIGSIANYYRKHGWVAHDPVAVQAQMIGNRYQFLQRSGHIKQPLSTSELPQYGIIPKVEIKHNALKVRVIEFDNRYSKEYWLGFPNFYVIKRYNQSDLYAMAVYQLSYYIRTLKDRLNKE